MQDYLKKITTNLDAHQISVIQYHIAIYNMKPESKRKNNLELSRKLTHGGIVVAQEYRNYESLFGEERIEHILTVVPEWENDFDYIDGSNIETLKDTFNEYYSECGILTKPKNMFTSNVQLRILTHDWGKGSTYTQSLSEFKQYLSETILCI